MRESQADPISSIVKLVDGVNHFSDLLVYPTATEDVRQPLQPFMERTHWKAKQFEFELRTELKRLAADVGLVSPATDMTLQAGFEAILEFYRQAQASHLTAHTRAMITRQFREMRILYEEFASLSKAA
jgi:hypothetical protein